MARGNELTAFFTAASEEPEPPASASASASGMSVSVSSCVTCSACGACGTASCACLVPPRLLRLDLGFNALRAVPCNFARWHTLTACNVAYNHLPPHALLRAAHPPNAALTTAFNTPKA
jgi:hypothetical protein